MTLAWPWRRFTFATSPPTLDSALTEDAKARGISKNRRAIEAIRRGLGIDQVERSNLVAEIRAGRREVRADVAGVIREGRPVDIDG